MKPSHENRIRLRIKICTWIVITGLALSGLTAFPLETELRLITEHNTMYPGFMNSWLQTVYHAVKMTNRQFPCLSYGTDWLAFAHLLLAVLFIGPLKYPVKNIWVIEFGMLACLLVVPLAFIAGAIRDIPVFWRLIDCSFGIVGIIPLAVCYRDVNRLKSIENILY